MTNEFCGELISEAELLISQGKFTELLNHKEALDEFTRYQQFVRSNVLQSSINANDVVAVPPSKQPAAAINDRVMISANNMVDSVNAALQGSAAIKHAVAATGTGKSTEIPFVVAESKKCRVLLIEPDINLATSLYSYLKTKNRSVAFDKISSTEVVRTGLVVISVASTVLTRLMTDKTAYDDFSVVLLDESHSTLATYTALKSYFYNFGANWRILYMTATINGESLNYDKKHNLAISSLQIKDIKDIAKYDDRSKLHPANIRNRNLFFVETQDVMDMVYKYYDDMGVDVYTVSRNDSYQHLLEIRQTLNVMANKNVIVFSDESLEYGVTLAVETVIDTGKREILLYDASNRSFAYQLRNIDVNESLQRAGRAGRMADGSYKLFNVDVIKKPVNDELMKYYSYLWLYAFNIKPNGEIYKEIAKVFSYMSREKARQMLHINLHPAMVNNYFIGDAIYRNVAGALKDYSIANAKFTVSDQLMTCGNDWHVYRFITSDGQILKLPIPINPVSVFSHISAIITVKMLSFRDPITSSNIKSRIVLETNIENDVDDIDDIALVNDNIGSVIDNNSNSNRKLYSQNLTRNNLSRHNSLARTVSEYDKESASTSAGRGLVRRGTADSNIKCSSDYINDNINYRDKLYGHDYLSKSSSREHSTRNSRDTERTNSSKAISLNEPLLDKSHYVYYDANGVKLGQSSTSKDNNVKYRSQHIKFILVDTLFAVEFPYLILPFHCTRIEDYSVISQSDIRVVKRKVKYGKLMSDPNNNNDIILFVKYWNHLQRIITSIPNWKDFNSDDIIWYRKIFGSVRFSARDYRVLCNVTIEIQTLQYAYNLILTLNKRVYRSEKHDIIKRTKSKR